MKRFLWLVLMLPLVASALDVQIAPKFGASVGIASAVTATTQVRAAPSAGRKNYLTGLILNVHGTDTGQTLTVVTGTGTNCGTGQADVAAFYLPAQSGTSISVPLSTPWAFAADKAICVKPSGAVAFTAIAFGFEAP